jgi:hypothetical protein
LVPGLPPLLSSTYEGEDFAPTTVALDEFALSHLITHEVSVIYWPFVEELPVTVVPPTPPAVRRRGTSADERKQWEHELLRRLREEAGYDAQHAPLPIPSRSFATHVAALQWQAVRTAAAFSGGQIETSAVDRIIVPAAASGAYVRAHTSGWIQYVAGDVSLCAVLVGDDGQRYLIVGLAQRPERPRYVLRGEIIGLAAVRR